MPQKPITAVKTKTMNARLPTVFVLYAMKAATRAAPVNGAKSGCPKDSRRLRGSMGGADGIYRMVFVTHGKLCAAVDSHTYKTNVIEMAIKNMAKLADRNFSRGVTACCTSPNSELGAERNSRNLGNSRSGKDRRVNLEEAQC